MELIFIFAIVFFEVFLIYLLQVMQVIRAFWINAFVYDKMLTVFFGNQRVGAVRTTKLKGSKSAVLRRESGRADSTEELPLGAIVLIEKKLGSIASGAGTVIRDVAFRPSADGSYFLAIPLFKVRDKVSVVPVLAEISNQGEFINLELLVLRRMGIIKSPLLERDISAYKLN